MDIPAELLELQYQALLEMCDWLGLDPAELLTNDVEDYLKKSSDPPPPGQ